MFDRTALNGFVNTLTVQTAGMNADAARAALARTATAERDRVMGGQPTPSGYRQVVDGKAGAPFREVRPDGVILLAFTYLREVVADTFQALVNRSPRRSGRYVEDLILLVDGAEGDLAAITGDTAEVRIVASADYARRLEVGKRKDGSAFVQQVAQHIVEETAIVARRLYGDLAKITFGYVDLSDAYRLRTAASVRKRHGVQIVHVQYPAITIAARTA